MDNNGGSEIIESGKEISENQIWRKLPLDLLRSVICNLEIKENVRASVVCKSWYEAAVSVRVIDQPPWLICFSILRNFCEFYNPSNFKKYTIELPKSLAGSVVRYSRDGWLLMSKKNSSSDFVLFNPFTMDLVVLPYLELLHGYQLVGFSCAPTSSNCVVFTIKDYDPGHVTIRTWSPGETVWTSTQIDSQFLDAEKNHVIFSNGLFYCLNPRNYLAVFDPSLRTWTVLDVPPPRFRDDSDDVSCYDGKLMVGYKGDIFVICTYRNDDPLVFKLDLTRGIWEQKDTLGSLTIFVSVKSGESRTYVQQGMLRNSVYFPKLCHIEKRFVAYSFDERRYNSCERDRVWGNQPFSDEIWIQAPDNASELLEKFIWSFDPSTS